ncbi:MAG: DUF3568 family protein [Nitrospirales bacterium]|nr:DUF3568 domain-containing protein [Nitrospirales bacterium]
MIKHLRNFTSKYWDLWIIIPILFSTGCVALMVGAGAGAAGTVYVMGKLQERVEAKVQKVQEAAIAGLQDLNLPIRKNQGDKLSANIESETADEKTIWVHVDFISESFSELTIRVGLTGDEHRSREILRAIKRHLS